MTTDNQRDEAYLAWFKEHDFASFDDCQRAWHAACEWMRSRQSPQAESSGGSGAVPSTEPLTKPANGPEVAPWIDAEWKLPCEVRLPNGMTIGKGVHLHTLLTALKRRQTEYANDPHMLTFSEPHHRQAPAEGMAVRYTKSRYKLRLWSQTIGGEMEKFDKSYRFDHGGEWFSVGYDFPLAMFRHESDADAFLAAPSPPAAKP